jgi:MFS family permease
MPEGTEPGTDTSVEHVRSLETSLIEEIYITDELPVVGMAVPTNPVIVETSSVTAELRVILAPVAATPRAVIAPAATAVPALVVHLPGPPRASDWVDRVSGTWRIPHRAPVQAVLLGAFGLDTLLYSMVVPFLPSHARQLGASPFTTGALFAAYAAGLLVAALPAGLVTTRLGARRTLLLGTLALVIATIAFALAPGLALLFVARAIQGVAGALTWTAGLALVAIRYPSTERSAVFARLFIATGAGTLLGPPLGGILFATGGFRLPFLVACVLVAAAGVAGLLVLPADAPPPRTSIERRTPHGRSRARRPMWRDDRFLVALVVTLAGGTLLALLEPSVPILLTSRFGLRPLVTGLVFGGLAALFMAVQPLVARLAHRAGAEITMLLGLLLGALALAGIGASQTLPAMILSLAGVAGGAACILVPSLALLALVGDRARRGRQRETHAAIFAAYNAAYAGGLLLGPLLIGLAITAWGAARGLAGLAVVPVAAAIIVAWQRLLVRRRRGAHHEHVHHKHPPHDTAHGAGASGGDQRARAPSRQTSRQT